MIQTEESNGAVVVTYINQKRKMVWDTGKCWRGKPCWNHM